jgi:hypothetical protein
MKGVGLSEYSGKKYFQPGRAGGKMVLVTVNENQARPIG